MLRGYIPLFFLVGDHEVPVAVLVFDGRVDDNPLDPELQGAFAFKGLQVQKHLHKSILQYIFGLKIRAGIPLAYRQHLARVPLVQQLLGVPLAGHGLFDEVSLGGISGFENLQRRFW